MTKYDKEEGEIFAQISVTSFMDGPCSDTTTFFFVLQSQLTKLSAIPRWMLNAAAVLILASRLKVITLFFWPSQRVPRLWSAQRTLHLEVKHVIKPIVWVATQTRVAISQRVRK